MKTSSVFFKHKLKSIFTSPLFWVDLVLMMAVTAFAYITRTKFFSAAGTSSLTAYFTYVPYASIILVPAFCLKKDSPYDDFVPLSEAKKLLLNFSAHILAGFAMVLSLMWMPVFVNFYGDVDWGACLVSFWALAFFVSCSIALCFLVSSFFEKPVVSFAVSALVLAAVNSCHSLGSYFNVPTFLSNFLLGISFAGRFDSASKGIFSSRDFLFFVICSFCFLFVSLVSGEKKKGKIWGGKEKRILALVSVFFVLLFANNQRFGFNGDFSKDKVYSVSDYTKKLLKETGDSVTIHYFKSSKLESIYPSVKNVNSFLNNYSRAGKNISYQVTDCDKSSETRELLSGYGIHAQRIRTENSTSTEYIDVYSSVVIESFGNIEVIPFVLTPASLEYQLDMKLLKLVYGFGPELNVLCANDMTLDDDLRLLKEWFSNSDLKVNELAAGNLQEQLSSVSGPVFVFGEEYISYADAALLEDYCKNGKGSVLFANSPYSVDLKGDWALYENTNRPVTDLLLKYGVQFKGSLVKDYSCQRISMMSEESGSDYAEVINYPLWLDVLPQSNASLGVSMFWATPMELSGNAVPYLVSSSYSYEEPLNFDNSGFLIETNPFKVNLQNVQTNALQKQILSCFVPVEENECTDNVYTKCGFYVISDQYFASYYTNGFIGGETGDFRNFMFLTNLFWKMNGNAELAALQSKTTRDTSLYKRTRGPDEK